MERYKIGKIVNVVGIKGEIKVYNYSDYKERFEELDVVFTKDETLIINNVRYMKELPILKIQGVDTRNQAELLKGKELYITEDMLRVLPEDTFYVKDLIGIKVFDENNTPIGAKSDIFKNQAQDLYEIETENNKKILIPAVEEFIINIDIKNKLMKVRLIEGLIDL